MKLTKSVIKQFEHDQAESDTKTALYNIIWQLATGILKDIGVKRVKTYTKK